MLAPIYASTIYFTSPCPIRTHKSTARVEPVVAFVLGKDLGPRSTAYTDDELLAVISEMRLALELLGGRYTDPSIVSFPEKLADGCSTTKDCSCCSQRSRSDARCFLADGPGSELPARALVLAGQLPGCPRRRP